MPILDVYGKEEPSVFESHGLLWKKGGRKKDFTYERIRSTSTAASLRNKEIDTVCPESR